MPKLTSNPVCYERVAFDRFTRGILDLEQKRGNIDYAALRIQGLALVLLLVDTNNVCKIVHSLL